MPSGKPIDWPQYDHLFREYLPNMTLEQFTATYLPHISPKAVGARARKLGIRPAKYKPDDAHKTKIAASIIIPWSADADAILVANAATLSVKELAILVGRDKTAVWRRLKQLGFDHQDSDIAAKHNRRTREALARPETRAKLGRAMRGRKLSDEHKLKLAEARRRQSGRLSLIQQAFYDLASALGLTYYREDAPECHFGPWTFDGLIVSITGTKTLVEIQGEWVHNQQKTISKDVAKATYVATYFPEIKLEYIWEAEFSSPTRVRERLLQIAGLKQVEQIDFNLNDVRVGICDFEVARRFVTAYHYLSSLRGRILFAAYLGELPIALAAFGAPTRAETAQRLGVKVSQCLELRRLVIREGYNKLNFASWFLGRVTPVVSPTASVLVTFADPVFGHNGTVYKACGWVEDGETEGSYFYINNAGYVMHKKTLFERANAQHMKEAAYAAKHQWVRVPEPPKKRFVKWLSRDG